jgi:hypothetical protein
MRLTTANVADRQCAQVIDRFRLVLGLAAHDKVFGTIDDGP